MPTKRRRLVLTPSDEVWNLLDEVKSHTDQPLAAIASEMLDQLAPAIQVQLHALRMLADAPREAQRIIQNQSNVLVHQLAQANLDLDAEIDARTVKGKRRRARARSTP